MPAKRSRITPRRPWTATDLSVLRRDIKRRQKPRDIAKKLNRTEGAIRQKMFAEGIFVRAYA